MLCIFSSLVHAKSPDAQTIAIAAPHITSLIEEDQSGIYQGILNEAISDMPFKIIQSYTPYKRALVSFEQGHTDYIYSFTQVMQEKLGNENIIASFPLGAFAYYMFSPLDQSPLTSSSQLKGLNVGAVHVHENYYKHRLSEKIKLDKVYKDAQNLKKLKVKRIDVMIAALPDLQPFVDQLSYSAKHPLVESYDRITCHNKALTQSFLDELSPRLKRMKDSGRYKEISGELFFDFDSEYKQQ
ncbi:MULTISPECIES: transporter substrate-binding domain-containing protein [unclassified Oleiphilus]|uniref:transporter substrate-binding domain-containing protein n=3 Tax=Oleiphilus TaxID=141450 RepID=UPI0009EE4E09|nr:MULTISPECIES: transporter substrate-binding domain-containing protein [unclassified Oleiphilus]